MNMCKVTVVGFDFEWIDGEVLNINFVAAGRRVDRSRELGSAGDVGDGVVSVASFRGGRAGIFEGVLVGRIVCDDT